MGSTARFTRTLAVLAVALFIASAGAGSALGRQIAGCTCLAGPGTTKASSAVTKAGLVSYVKEVGPICADLSCACTCYDRLAATFAGEAGPQPGSTCAARLERLLSRIDATGRALLAADVPAALEATHSDAVRAVVALHEGAALDIRRLQCGMPAIARQPAPAAAIVARAPWQTIPAVRERRLAAMATWIPGVQIFDGSEEIVAVNQDQARAAVRERRLAALQPSAPEGGLATVEAGAALSEWQQAVFAQADRLGIAVPAARR